VSGGGGKMSGTEPLRVESKSKVVSITQYAMVTVLKKCGGGGIGSSRAVGRGLGCGLWKPGSEVDS
jgi:hypothetical protein